MAIVKSLIDKMNGTIEITSVEDEGSIFTITIPFEIAAKPEPKTDTSTAGNKPDISGLNLLLTEDNDLNAEIAEMLLSDQGANITIVKDGRQAIDAFINISRQTGCKNYTNHSHDSQCIQRRCRQMHCRRHECTSCKGFADGQSNIHNSKILFASAINRLIRTVFLCQLIKF